MIVFKGVLKNMRGFFFRKFFFQIDVKLGKQKIIKLRKIKKNLRLGKMLRLLHSKILL